MRTRPATTAVRGWSVRRPRLRPRMKGASGGSASRTSELRLLVTEEKRGVRLDLGFPDKLHSFILDDISCQPSDWNKRLRSFRVRVSAGGPNWAGCAFLGRTHEDVFGPVS